MSITRALLLIAFATAAHAAPPAVEPGRLLQPPKERQAVPGRNVITHLQVDAGPSGGWVVTVDYQYTGEPEGARLEVKQSVTKDASDRDAVLYRSAGAVLQKGRHRVQLPLERPSDENDRYTQRVIAEIVDAGYTSLARQVLAQGLEWPDEYAERVYQASAGLRPEVVMRKAIALIDAGHRSTLREAKVLLERVVRNDPKADQAYLELARIAMKTNWGPEGLGHAEALIKSALQIRPDSVNARILLGYVYSNQGRTRDGAALFEEAARAGTQNLWLWTNWGEMLMREGKPDEAIAKFREAIKVPRSDESHDRARPQAYYRLLQVYRERGDLDAMEEVFRQRGADYPGYVCHTLAYARFLVTRRGDAAAAQAMLDKLPAAACESGDGRMLQALVRYVAWAGLQGPQRAEALRLARVEMPVGPQLFHLLAETDQTLVAARQLVAAGEKLDMQDNHGMDALAYALAGGDTDVARRLLAIGARPDTLVGPERIPVALLPVVSRNFAAIELMRKAGVDYKQVRFRGMTALDVARQEGDEALLRAVDPGSRRL